MNELATTLDHMGFVQLVLAFTFMTSYALTIGGMFESVGRRRAGLVAFAAAIAFASMTRPWMHGALLLVISIAGVGLFIVAVWALNKIVGMPRDPQELLHTERADAVPVVYYEPAHEPESRLLTGMAGAASCREGAQTI